MIKGKKTKILIIDDNHSILDYLKTFLVRYNFDIKTCTNGYDGLQEVAEYKPDIVFLDLMMPNLDGLQVLQLKKVLKDIRDIPVIVISANAGRKNVLAAIEAGADKVLAKPIDLKQLKSSINELLEESFFDEILDNPEIPYPQKDCSGLNSFYEKFNEYKDSLVEAIRNRDPESVKGILKMLQEYSKECSNQEMRILFELGRLEYSKPSDWMLAEIKISEIEQSVKQTLNEV